MLGTVDELGTKLQASLDVQQIRTRLAMRTCMRAHAPVRASVCKCMHTRVHAHASYFRACVHACALQDGYGETL